MMNEKAKEAWINALRSDEYNQSYSALRKEAGYCCLGVLVDCYIKDGGTTLTWHNDTDSPGNFYALNQYEIPEELELPNDESFRDWYGDIPDNILRQLVNLNDSETYNFNQIADYIEESL